MKIFFVQLGHQLRRLGIILFVEAHRIPAILAPDRQWHRFQTSPTLKPQDEDLLCAAGSSASPARDNTVRRSASHSSHTCPRSTVASVPNFAHTEATR